MKHMKSYNSYSKCWPLNYCKAEKNKIRKLPALSFVIQVIKHELPPKYAEKGKKMYGIGICYSWKFGQHYAYIRIFQTKAQQNPWVEPAFSGCNCFMLLWWNFGGKLYLVKSRITKELTRTWKVLGLHGYSSGCSQRHRSVTCSLCSTNNIFNL